MDKNFAFLYGTTMQLHPELNVRPHSVVVGVVQPRLYEDTRT